MFITDRVVGQMSGNEAEAGLRLIFHPPRQPLITKEVPAPDCWVPVGTGGKRPAAMEPNLQLNPTAEAAPSLSEEEP